MCKPLVMSTLDIITRKGYAMDNAAAERKRKCQEILKSEDYREELASMAKNIVRESKIAPNEATIESRFDCELFHFFRTHFSSLGFEYAPTKEQPYKTVRHILNGRADTALSSLVVEFKQPSTLSNGRDRKKAIEQISDYLIENEKENGTASEGFVTDGLMGCFLQCEGGTVTHENFYGITGESLDRIIHCIVQVELIALNSKNLVDGLCKPPDNNGVAFKLMQALYSIIVSDIHPKTEMLYEEWQQLFNLAHDDISKQQAIQDRKCSLESLFGISLPTAQEQYRALFSLQTAYAIIVKCIAYKVVSQVRYNSSVINFYDVMGQDSEKLRIQMTDLENGSIFAQYEVTNLLEGDFFSWYTNDKQWNKGLYTAIDELFEVLSRFSDTPTINSIDRSRDFFKELYQAMVPAAVRHSLGEFYTKKWLATSVVTKTLSMVKNKNWKALDPCCGSGTFLTVLIDKVLKDNATLTNAQKLQAVLTRVVGIDLNPLAALTARVNYFMNIAYLIEDNNPLEIPVYLGDSSYVPEKITLDQVPCLRYSISTRIKPIEIVVPQSMVRDPAVFSRTMNIIEGYIKALDSDLIEESLSSLCSPSDLTPKTMAGINSLATQLVDLEKRQWDGVWARIITNFLTTANLGHFDLIVGNPPWVDWKSLPSGYRDRIKGLCISRNLFSGDTVTGGINLNICALITNVAAQNWLSQDGVIGFLMPEPLVFQRSYEGFRNLLLADNDRLFFNKFDNWNKAGHPFKPVTQKFLTFYMSRTRTDYIKGVETTCYTKKKTKGIDPDTDENLDFAQAFSSSTKYLATCNPKQNFFSYIDSRSDADIFKKIAGLSKYIGREGIEFYPQELMVFQLSATMKSTSTCTALDNVQMKKSKYSVPKRSVLLETEWLHPMVKGPDIRPFHVVADKYIVAFPYEKKNPKYPLSERELSRRAPKLAKYYRDNQKMIIEQTGYSDHIIGNKDAEYYALARVGAYSYAPYYVTFRDNTKWVAAVVSTVDTQWGGKKRPVFQNHAVSICEDSTGRYITCAEAYFICGILNSPIVCEYMRSSSDSRSFPIRPRIQIPKYDPSIPEHLEIAELSKSAHVCWDDQSTLDQIRARINRLYIGLFQSYDGAASK